jgi:hypothetical protein
MTVEDTRVVFERDVLFGRGAPRAPVIGWLPVEDVVAGRLGLPDSPTTRAADALCRHASEPFLANHQVRSYLWASVLGRAEGIDVDHESLFVAAALHDLGLTDRYWGERCFEVVGGGVAAEFLVGQGWPPERAEVVRRAIELHIEQSVPIELGAVAHVLDLGVTVDVSGGRLDEIDPAVREEVLAAYPRLDFKRFMTQLLRRDADAHPDCATARWFDQVDLAGRIANAAFDE